MKCVMIVDETLPGGLIANTTAALGVSLGSKVSGLTGQDIIDESGRNHLGITNIPIPILAMDPGKLKIFHDELLAIGEKDLIVFGFNQVAQQTMNYDEYDLKLRKTKEEDIQILGICIYGKRTRINKLTGNLRMLR